MSYFKIGVSDEEREASIRELHAAPADAPGVAAWSVSVLDAFSECKHRVFLSHVRKIKTDDIHKNEAAVRGINVHEVLEDYVSGRREDLKFAKDSYKPKKLFEYLAYIEELRALYEAGQASVEGKTAFNAVWGKVDFFDKSVWGRVIYDARVQESPSSVRIIDWKTGKLDGNEVKHGGAKKLYSLAEFMLHPETEFVTTEFVYLDDGRPPVRMNFSRKELNNFLLPAGLARIEAMMSERKFVATPSRFKCRMCPYNSRRAGGCDYSAE